MGSTVVDRVSVATDLMVARRRAWALTPYSPAWDAAMAVVEDLERALWRLDHPEHAPSLDLGRADSILLRTLSQTRG